MKLKIIIVFLITALVHFSSPLISMAETFYVETDGSDENDGSEEYPWGTIQGAIDNSTVEDGDTIYIGSGTFTENITVDKSIEIYGDETIITASDSSDNVFSISSDDVEIESLTIKGADGSGAAGVYVGSDIDDFSISYCELKDNEYGVYLYNADDSEITSNEFEDNTVGIYLVQSEIEDIYSNDFEDGDYGIFLLQDDDEYYSDDDVSQLEDDNDFNNIDEADVYLGEKDEVDNEEDSCFIKTICFGLCK